METPKSKAELLEIMETGRKEWLDLLARVDKKSMEEPGVEGDWSVKDIVAHILGYEQYAAALLMDQKAGTTQETQMLDAYFQTQLALYRRTHPEFPEQLAQVKGDEVNKIFVAASRYKDIDEVRQMEQAAYNNLLEQINVFDDSELRAPFTSNGKSLIDIIPNQVYAHYRLHTPAIEQWLERK